MKKQQCDDDRCSFESTIQGIQDDMKRVVKCLYGDGNPGQGLTDRVSVVQNQQKWINRLFGITIFLLLVLLGVKELPSLLSLIK